MSNLPVRKIKAVDGEKVLRWEFNAFKVTDNLFIHKRIDYSTGKPTRERIDVKWSITAQPSGIAVWHCDSKEQAAELARALNNRFDFSKTAEELLADEDLMKNGIKFIREFELATI
ncbi:MAG: hypothetical protein WDA59_07175 [Methanofastidiosum sp.]